jgi:hypothetical protein
MYVCVNAKHDVDTSRGDDARQVKAIKVQRTMACGIGGDEANPN